MMEPGLWGSDEGGLVSRGGSGMVSDMSAASSLLVVVPVSGSRRRQPSTLGRLCGWWSQNHGRRALGRSFPNGVITAPLANCSAPGNA